MKETKLLTEKLINNKLARQIFRFAMVGGTAFLIDAGLLYILTEFVGLHHLVSSAVSFSVSVIYNYILSILWVFETDREKDKGRKFVIFLVLSIIGLGLNQLLMWLLSDVLTIYYMLSKVIATVFVMLYNFVTRKIFLEKKAPDENR